MTILLSGATGFIGRHVLRQALAEGHRVVVVLRGGSPHMPVPQTDLRILNGGLTGVDPVSLDGCETCIHLAAHGVVDGSDDWEECFRVNVQDSLRFWMTATEAGVRRFVIGGSCFEYGQSGERYDFIPIEAPLEPTGAYPSSKAAATMAAMGFAVDRNLELVVLRPFHVYGEGESSRRLWPSLRRAALANEDFSMTAGEQVRDFIPVEEVANVFLRKATESGCAAGKPAIENLGSGSPVTIRAFAEFWWSRWAAKGKLRFGELPYRPNEVMRYVPKLG